MAFMEFRKRDEIDELAATVQLFNRQMKTETNPNKLRYIKAELIDIIEKINDNLDTELIDPVKERGKIDRLIRVRKMAERALENLKLKKLAA